MVQGMKNVPYEERLKKLGVCSVEQRILRGDLIETFKILTGKTMLDPDHERTRGHHLKLQTNCAVHQARAKFFSHRVVSHWNRLPEEVVSAPSTNCFKNRLDQHWATRKPLSPD